jgi:hypothetical protein
MQGTRGLGFDFGFLQCRRNVRWKTDENVPSDLLIWLKPPGIWSYGLFGCVHVEWNGIRRRIRRLCVLAIGGLIQCKSEVLQLRGSGCLGPSRGLCALHSRFLLCCYISLASILSPSLLVTHNLQMFFFFWSYRNKNIPCINKSAQIYKLIEVFIYFNPWWS